MKLKYPTLIMMLFSTNVFAHGPTPQKTDESVIVQASPDVVWKQLSEICAIKNWHPAVADCQSAAPNKRVLTLKSGAKISEEFDEVLDKEKAISYRLGSDSDTKAMPVSSLTGRIKVKAEQSGSKIEWMARYYRVDTTNEPPKGMDDEAARNGVNGYVKAGLSALATGEPVTKK